MATLAEFVAFAEQTGCRLKILNRPLDGPRSSEDVPYLVGPDGQIALLPAISSYEHLSPTVLASLERVLRIEMPK